MEELTDLVIEVVRAELRETTRVIEKTTPLQALSGFNSLAIAGIIERLETHLGIEIEPALILPQTFTNPLTLAEALWKSQQDIHNYVS